MTSPAKKRRSSLNERSSPDTPRGSIQRRASRSPASAEPGSAYSLGPNHRLGGTVQRKVVMGRGGDRFEKEADNVADRVQRGEPAGEVSRIPPGGLSAQSKATEEESSQQNEEKSQELGLQRQEEEGQEQGEEREQEMTHENEAEQEPAAQRQEEEKGQEREEESQEQEEQGQEQEEGAEPEQETGKEEQSQSLRVQRQEDKGQEQEEEPKQEASKEEESQSLTLQREEEQEGPGEEPEQETSREEQSQSAALQRQEEESEPEAPGQEASGETESQPQALQRQAEDGEVPEEEHEQEAAEEEEGQETPLAQAKSAKGAPEARTRKKAVVSGAIHSRGPGEPLQPSVRRHLQGALGVDMGDVRVHSDSRSRDTAKTIRARAFTHKNHIWLGPAESKSDLKLMAHEGTHVLQQGGIVRRKPESDGPGPPRMLQRTAGAPTPATHSRTTFQGSGGPTSKMTVGEAAAGRDADQGPAREAGGPVAAPEGREAPAAPVAPEAKDRIAGEKEMRPSEEKKGPPAEVAGAPADEGPSEGGGEGAGRLKEVQDNLRRAATRQEGPAARRSAAKRASTKASSDASAAAPSPPEEAPAMGEADQVKVMNEQNPGEVDQEDFLTLVKAKLREMEVPANAKQMSEFKKKKGASGLKGVLQERVEGLKKKASGDISQATRAEPKPAAPRQPAGLAPTKPAPHTGRIHAQRVLPRPKTDEQVSLQKNKEEVDRELRQKDLTRKRLLEANDPRFSAVVEAHDELAQHTRDGPRQYRQEETEFLSTQKEGLGIEEKTGLRRMRSARSSANSRLSARQQAQMKADTAKRVEIAADLKEIYSKTKTDVDLRLKQLDGKVDEEFTASEQKARDLFENYVDEEFGSWKSRRYKGVRGKWRWLKDRFRDINELKEVKQIYLDGQQKYFGELDRGIDRIGKIVDTDLEWCKTEIKKGRQQVQVYLDGLDKGVKHLATEAAEEIMGQFDDLRNHVEDQREALADKLVERYQESRRKLDERIEAIKQANRSFVVKAKRKIEEVYDALVKFKEKLKSALKGQEGVVGQIIRHPIRFLKNLLRALGKGFTQFKSRIGEHLKTALVRWLFGSLRSTGIKLPTEFSFTAIMGMILQVVGVTYQKVRAKAVRYLGRRNVAAVEKMAGYLKTLFVKGPGGLWEELKGDLGDIKEKVLGEVQEWLITTLIKKGVAKLAMMFNPVGAIVQAVITIYNVVMFFIERIEEIGDLVATILKSLGQIVKGKIQAAANMVEKALVLGLSLAIAFLARLAGIGGIAGKVRRIIKRIRGRVDRALNKAVRRIALRFKSFIKRGKRAVGRAAKRVKEFFFPPQRFTAGGKPHILKAETKGRLPKLVIESSPGTEVQKYVWKLRPQIKKITDRNARRRAYSRYGKAKRLARSSAKRMETVFKAGKPGPAKTRLQRNTKKLIKLIQEIWKLTGPPKMLPGEGAVGYYGTLPVKKGQERNHVPQNALLKRLREWVATYLRRAGGKDETVRRRAKLAGLRVRHRAVRGYKASHGVVIRMAGARHHQTRTYAKLPQPLNIPKGEFTGPTSTDKKHAADAQVEKFLGQTREEFRKDKEDVIAIYEGNKGLPPVGQKSKSKIRRAMGTVQGLNVKRWGSFIR